MAKTTQEVRPQEGTHEVQDAVNRENTAQTGTPSGDEVVQFDVGKKTFLEQVQHVLHGNPTIVPILVLAASVAIFGLLAGDKFFSPFNLSLILQQVSIIGILASAQGIIIITAGVDLSVAAIMVLMSVIAGKLAIDFGVPAPLAIIASLAGGGLAGTLNGFFVTKLRLPPFIVTLGTWSIFYSLVLWLTGAQSIRSQTIDAQAPLLKFFGNYFSIGGARLTLGSVLMVLVVAVLWYALNKTAWGKHVYAVGDDKDAAELAGIRTDRVLLSVYAVAGVICAIAGWASIGRIGSISPQSFYEANLHSITAVFIGGISMFGGRGSVIGALFGALIVGVFQSGLRIIGVDVLWQVFAIGWLIIVAVGIDQWIRKVSA